MAVDTLQTIGLAMLVLIILPELDVVKGAMLMNAVCVVPGLLNAFTRNSTEPRYPIMLILDVLAISAQVTAFVVWPLLDGTPALWCTPFACLFISIGWWENFTGTIGRHTPGMNLIILLYLVYMSFILSE